MLKRRRSKNLGKEISSSFESYTVSSCLVGLMVNLATQRRQQPHCTFRAVVFSFALCSNKTSRGFFSDTRGKTADVLLGTVSPRLPGQSFKRVGMRAQVIFCDLHASIEQQSRCSYVKLPHQRQVVFHVYLAKLDGLVRRQGLGEKQRGVCIQRLTTLVCRKVRERVNLNCG